MTSSKWFQIEPPAGTVIFGHLWCVRGTASEYLQISEVMGSMMSVHQTTARGQWFVRGGSWASCWLCSGLKLPDSCLWWIVQPLLVGLVYLILSIQTTEWETATPERKVSSGLFHIAAAVLWQRMRLWLRSVPNRLPVPVILVRLWPLCLGPIQYFSW